MSQPAINASVRNAIEIAVYLLLLFAILSWCLQILMPFVSFLAWGTIIAVAMHQPFHVLYRQHRNPLFETVMQRSRARRFLTAIPRSETRSLLKQLGRNHTIWYAPDQNHGGNNPVFAPFFGIPAATLTATSRLAKMSGAAVVPFFQMRLPGNQGYLLMLCPALDNFPGDDPRADAARINRVIEDVVREMPEQYLWVHRRFKTRPPGEAYPY